MLSVADIRVVIARGLSAALMVGVVAGVSGTATAQAIACRAQVEYRSQRLSARIEGCSLGETLRLLQQHAKVAAYLPEGSMAGQPVWAAVQNAPLPSAVEKLLANFSYVLQQRDDRYVLYLLPDARYPRLLDPAAVLPVQAVVRRPSRRIEQQLEAVMRLADSSEADAVPKLASIAKGSDADISIEARVEAVAQLTQRLLSSTETAAVDVRSALVEISNISTEAVRAGAQEALLEFERRARQPNGRP